MHGYLILIPIFVFIVVLLISTKRTKRQVGFPYVPAKTLFSAAERKFMTELDMAVGLQYRVFGKVRIADVATVKQGLSRSSHQAALNRIAAKHFDFVICRRNDLSVVCAVELNDSSHNTKRVQRRDVFVAQVCQAVRLPLWNVTVAAAYSPEALSSQFQSIIVGTNSAGRTT
jgi:hypothetical protein